MRKVVLGMQVSLDGFVATTDGNLDWAMANFEPGLLEAIGERLSRLDVMVMGRNNYLEQAAHWPHVEGDPIADIVNSVEKVVFSSTLENLDWSNSRLATGNPAQELARLREGGDGEIGVSGGATFAGSLAAEGLIDEYSLAVHPVVLGDGIPLFISPQPLNLTGTRRFDTGVVLNTYRPAVPEPAGA